jgi:K+-transporting ATPase ATPase A chain
VIPSSLFQYAAFVLCVALLAWPLGAYIERVFAHEKTFLDRLLLPIEGALHRALGVDPHQEMTWKEYASAFIVFSACGCVLVYALLRLQRFFPGYDTAAITTPMAPDLAFNTAVSFATTTTWQAYAGETTMSSWSQLVALMSQNFLAGAAGLSVGIAFLRGLAREKSTSLGNFWSDLVRSLMWILLPLSLFGAVILVWQGVPTTFAATARISTLEGSSQSIAQGPVAPFEIIKNLGSNGGGFFNANGAHPYEVPTPLANFVLLLAIVAIPAALTHTFGRMVGRPRQGWVLFWVMMTILVAGLAVCHRAESSGSAALRAAGLPRGPNLEGKETRFGVGGSVLAAVATSNGATGSYNSMHDSYTPIGGMVTLFNMLLGEIAFGGLGTGIMSLLLTGFLGLFAAGLMVGRTPECVGKTIGATEMKLVLVYALAAPLAILIPTAIAVRVPAGLAALTTNQGAHGYTEILVAFASCFANNGQSFAGLSTNSSFYNVVTAVVMIVGRFGLTVPALALAGRFAAQGRRPMTAGTLATDSVLFGLVLVATALVVGALSYLPALCLGPLAEHLGT